MSVSIIQLAAGLRVGDGVASPDEPLLSILTRLDGVADAFLGLLASDSPSAVQDEAKVRFASYLYDQPNVVSGDRYASAWRNSGAAALVANWQVRRVVADSATTAPAGSGLSETAIQNLIDATIATHALIIAAHHVPGTGGTSEPVPSQYLAVGATETQTAFAEADFTGSLGVEFVTDTVTIPTYTGFGRVAIARISTAVDLVYIDFADQGLNQLNAFTKLPNTVDIGSESYNVWLSNQFLGVSALSIEVSG